MSEIPRSHEIDRERERQKEAIFGKTKESSSDSEVADISFDEDEEEETEEQKIERMRKRREALYKVRKGAYHRSSFECLMFCLALHALTGHICPLSIRMCELGAHCKPSTYITVRHSTHAQLICLL